MPTQSDLHIDSLLSNLSIAYMNEPSSYIADRVFPVVLSSKQSDKYAKYEKYAWFRDEAQKRAPLTESAGGDYGMDTPGTFFCDEYSFHKDYADADIDNADAVFNLDEDSTQFTTEKLKIKRERNWSANYFVVDIWGTTLKGQTDTPGAGEYGVWDASGSTPIKDVMAAKPLIRLATGLEPNTLVVSERVHMCLTEHTDVLDRYKYTQAGIITEQLLAKVFEVQNYYVAKAVYATANEGAATQTMAYIADQYGALLVYANPRPSKRRPSGGYTFRWNRPRYNGASGERLQTTIKKWYEQKIAGTRIEASIFEDMRLVSSACGVFFKDAIALGRTITS